MTVKNPGTAPTVGLKHACYAILTQDDTNGVAYGAVKLLKDAMTAKISSKIDVQNISSDDQISEVIYSAGTIDVEVQQKNIPLDDQAILLGHQIVNGVMIRNKDDIAPEVAFGYMSKKSNGGYEYDWYLKGRFQEPDKEHESGGEKVNPKYKTIKGSFYPRLYDGNTSKQAEEDSLTYTAAIGASWFDAVEGAAPSAIALSSSTPADGAANVLATVKPALTFNNAIASYNNVMLLDETDNTLTAMTMALDGTGKILTISPTASLTAGKTYDIMLSGVTDVYGQTLAQQIVKFTVAA